MWGSKASFKINLLNVRMLNHEFVTVIVLSFGQIEKAAQHYNQIIGIIIMRKVFLVVEIVYKFDKKLPLVFQMVSQLLKCHSNFFVVTYR